MGEHFLKFKKKAFTVRLIKSILLGLSAGMLLSGIFLLLFKFEVIKGQPILSLPIGVGAFLLAGLGTYFVLHTSNKAIARRLDEEFSLNEKVQTMLAYEKEEGTIYHLQREDANESLRSIPTKRLKFKWLWAYIVGVAIGAVSLASGFLFSPVVTPPPPPVQEPFELTGIQKAAMEELIVYVESSAMQSPYKENVATSLKDLLSKLEAATLAKEKDEALKASMDYIYAQTDESSTAVELMNALWSSETATVQRLAETLNYYEWQKSDEWGSFSNEMTNFRTSFIHADTMEEEPDEITMAQDTGALLSRIESNVSIALTRAGVAEEDALSVQLKRFVYVDETYGDGAHLYGFAVLAGMAETLGYEKMQKELDATFAALGSEIFKALEEHAANTGTGEYAMTKLNELFLCGLPKFERPNFYEASEGDDPMGDGDEGGGGAGIGDGAVYGSDDLVLDPITNTYVEYGTILDKYYALMFSKVQDGDYTEQEKEAMEKYFAILYGGFEEEGE